MGWEYKNKWMVFYFAKRFNITFERCGYFDNRPRINISLGFFNLDLIFPIRNKWTDECVPPKYGIAIHGNTFWIYKGGKGNLNGGNKWWTWDIPLLTKEWVRTSILLKDNTWEHESKGNSKKFYSDEWKSKQKVWEYSYEDNTDGEIIPTKVHVEEREWRPKWLTWTKFFRDIHRTIDVEFLKECGRGKGSWKGGVTGCSYRLLKNETPMDCIKRMEKERDL